VFDDRGNRMSPTYSIKNGVRYRLYVSSALLKGRKAHAGAASRIPAAADFEAAVIKAIRKKVGDLNSGSDQKPIQIIESQVSRVVLKENQAVSTLKASDGENPTVIEIPWTKEQRHYLSPNNVRAETECPPTPLDAQALVRAQTWPKLLSDGSYDSVEDLAKAINLHPKVIRKSIRVASFPQGSQGLCCRGSFATL
jgi:site-specific DNA recombinase